jgi:hypothetical protein
MIETQRLILRLWREEDLEPFAHLNADARVMEYFPGLKTRPESDSFIKFMSAHIEKYRLNLDDDAIRVKDSIAEERKEASAYVVSNLILARGVMEALDINQVHYVGTQGANAIGALLTQKYWTSTEELDEKN